MFCRKVKKERKVRHVLTHVCRMPWSIESLERMYKNQKVSANTVAYINCKSRVT